MTMPSMLHGQHDGADDVPLACAEAQGTLTVALRHRLEGLLRGADDGGQVHDHQRQAAGEQAGLEAHGLGEDQHTHKAVDDAGDARQRLIGELDDLDELPVGGILGQVDRRAHAQRKHDEQGQEDDIQRVEDGGQDAVGALEDAGGGGKEVPS